MASQIFSILLLVFGFGFVIFFHELGHFLAAKWVGIKVEQFAVGFGQAMISWRRGLGFRVGSSQKEFETRVDEHLAVHPPSDLAPRDKTDWSAEQHFAATQALGLGETEYRLNWIPLGGYVKMLGQDDLRPNAQADDPRAYNRKSIGARMFVVSAGVIMNIILAAIGFMIVFLMGFRAPPPIVGNVLPGSPAQKATREVNGKPEPAPLEVGDRILYFDGKYQHDFTKISLNAALVEENVPVPTYVRRVGGKEEHLKIVPERPDDPQGFLMIGVGQPLELRGIAQRDLQDDVIAADLSPEDYALVKPGDVITQVNGEPAQVPEYWKLDRAIQESGGKPVKLTVVAEEGKGASRTVEFRPSFQRPFREPLSFAGLVPRPSVESVMPDSPARGKLLPGDAVVCVMLGSEQISNPTTEEFINTLSKAGAQGQTVSIEVLRRDQPVTVKDLKATFKISKERYGLGVGVGFDEWHPVVAGPLKGSPAEAAGVPSGATITAIDDKPVQSWFDVHRLLGATQPETDIKITTVKDGSKKNWKMRLAPSQVDAIRGQRYAHSLLLHERVEPRKTDNPLTAAAWGITETRDFVLQFYLTIQRMFQRTVSYKNMMGPVGIFAAGTKFAYKGNDWLIWFLAMISANLAVVNFLPIPIVDGGLFTFLILEKIMGKPLSPRAQSIAQVVGLALLLSVFLLVTYQDISRFF